MRAAVAHELLRLHARTHDQQLAVAADGWLPPPFLLELGLGLALE